jgi:hypothetical protein
MVANTKAPISPATGFLSSCQHGTDHRILLKRNNTSAKQTSYFSLNFLTRGTLRFDDPMDMQVLDPFTLAATRTTTIIIGTILTE